jgi:hypothetical protein
MLQKKPYLFDFKYISNPDQGALSVAEYANSLPFEPKRIYWVYNTPENISRGNAANIKCKYALVCLYGSAKVHIEDLNQQSYHFELTDPNVGLFVPELNWRRIQIEPQGIMLCIASDRYDERDYIRDFSEFVKAKKRLKL